jgi:hypothetical protein
MDSGRACCLRMIIAELIKGAMTEDGVNVMKDLARVSPAGGLASYRLGMGRRARVLG